MSTELEVGGGDDDADADVVRLFFLWSKQAGLTSTVVPATVDAACSTSNPETGVRSEDEQEVAIREEAGTKLMLCSLIAAVSRLRLDLLDTPRSLQVERSVCPGEPPTAS